MTEEEYRMRCESLPAEMKNMMINCLNVGFKDFQTNMRWINENRASGNYDFEDLNKLYPESS